MENKGTVVILATGGTIAGIGKKGEDTGYIPGTLSVDKLIEQIPSITDIASLKAIQICNLNSDDITSNIWISLANKINELASDDNITGFVITHGTDTLEETAYFLNLTIKTDKPVVIIGSIRPTTSISPDGPENLYNAVIVASKKDIRNRGVMVILSNKIYSARDARKINANNVAAFNGGDMGTIGIIIDEEVRFYTESTKRHTINSEFDIDNIKKLPDVGLVYFHVDAKPIIIDIISKESDGLVIAGAGAGEFSIKWKEKIEKLSIPVIITTRTGNGTILEKSLLVNTTIPGDNLTPSKAVVLLRLALTKTKDYKEIKRIFNEY